MYDDMLKEKENLGIKLVQGEEEKKKMARENELLVKIIGENGRVCSVSFSLLCYTFCGCVCCFHCLPEKVCNVTRWNEQEMIVSRKTWK